ncbi:MAG: N-acetylmuramoyl-L-alanine amidase [Acetobacteraceae bacterium]
MSEIAPITRRLLLGRFGAGSVILGTTLIPQAALAASRKAKPKPSAEAPLVMLDPGHGGKDPGAIGISGTYEKHVALAAALELKRQLDAAGKYRVELTRSRDVFVPLEDRVTRAQGRGASLFVSMHADALTDSSVRGASVYTLGTPSDAQTAALARRENSADRFIGKHWQDASPEVARILSSLVRRETRVGSIRIAKTLVGSLDRDLPMLQNPDRHASFLVLKAADIPSVLVEMGFMSNAKDEAALRRSDHRRVIAGAMKRAIDTYFSTTFRADAAPPSLVWAS